MKQSGNATKKVNIFMLFSAFFKIGLFTFGGGYAMIALMEREIVEKKGWIDKTELMRIVAISELTPGPVSVNAATAIGYKMCKIKGSIFALLGVVMPSFMIILAISLFLNEFMTYPLVAAAFKGVRIGASILICSVGIGMINKIGNSVYEKLLFSFSFICIIGGLFFKSVSSIALLLIGIIVGIAFLQDKKTFGRKL